RDLRRSRFRQYQGDANVRLPQHAHGPQPRLGGRRRQWVSPGVPPPFGVSVLEISPGVRASQSSDGYRATPSPPRPLSVASSRLGPALRGSLPIALSPQPHQTHIRWPPTGFEPALGRDPDDATTFNRL